MIDTREQPKWPHSTIPRVDKYFLSGKIPNTLQPKEMALNPWYKLLSTLQLPKDNFDQLKKELTIAFILKKAAREGMTHLTTLKELESTPFKPDRILNPFTLLYLYPDGIPLESENIRLTFTPEEDTEKMLAAIRNIPGVNIHDEGGLLQYLTQPPFSLNENPAEGNLTRTLRNAGNDKFKPNDELVKVLNEIVNTLQPKF